MNEYRGGGGRVTQFFPRVSSQKLLSVFRLNSVPEIFTESCLANLILVLAATTLTSTLH